MRKTRTFILTIAILCCGALTWSRSASSHEPITTKVMFNREVIRILERSCLGCHSPGRIKSDIPLTSYDEARPWAKAIKEEVLEKRMMPFQVVKGYGSFQHDYILPQREIDLLISWIEGGAPRGEEKDYPQNLKNLLNENGGADDSWELGKPDLELKPKSEITIAAQTEEVTRCLSLPTNLKTNRVLRGFEFKPGNGAIVYSASFHMVKSAGATAACGGKAAPRLGAPFGTWVPAQPAVQFPKGYGAALPAGSSIVMRIRYKNSGDAATDRSALAVYFSNEARSASVQTVAITAPKLTVPPNAGNHRVKVSYSINSSAEVVAIRPLLFPYAKSVEATAYRPDGTIEVLAWARNYRFDWQPAYYFKKPVQLPKGTRIEITAYLDNSEENRTHPGNASEPLIFSDSLCELSLIAR